MKHTPSPWKPCRAHEDYQGPMFDIEPDEKASYEARPFVKIISVNGENVASAHDLFEFKKEDALLIAAAPEMLAMLKAANEAFFVIGTGKAVKKVMAGSKDLIRKAEGRE